MPYSYIETVRSPSCFAQQRLMSRWVCAARKYECCLCLWPFPKIQSNTSTYMSGQPRTMAENSSISLFPHGLSAGISTQLYRQPTSAAVTDADYARNATIVISEKTGSDMARCIGGWTRRISEPHRGVRTDVVRFEDFCLVDSWTSLGGA